jgi:hypothetical protein
MSAMAEEKPQFITYKPLKMNTIPKTQKIFGLSTGRQEAEVMSITPRLEKFTKP